MGSESVLRITNGHYQKIKQINGGIGLVIMTGHKLRKIPLVFVLKWLHFHGTYKANIYH